MTGASRSSTFSNPVQVICGMIGAVANVTAPGAGPDDPPEPPPTVSAYTGASEVPPPPAGMGRRTIGRESDARRRRIRESIACANSPRAASGAAVMIRMKEWPSSGRALY